MEGSAPRKDNGFPDWSIGPFRKQGIVLSPRFDTRFRCPILGREVAWEDQDVYNPAAVVRDGTIHLFYRSESRMPESTGVGDPPTCRIGMATSADGRNFTRYPAPVLYPDNDPWKDIEWKGGCSDPHVIEDETGLYHMNYTTWTGRMDTQCTASSRDLLHWMKHGPAFGKAYGGKYVPGSRSGTVVCRREGDRLISTRIKGRYWMYYTHQALLAWSDDLVEWTPVIDSAGRPVGAFREYRPGFFDSASCEAGAAALLTDQGICYFYNAQNMPQTGDPTLPGGTWSLGQALMDPDRLDRVVDRLARPFLFPEYDWEFTGLTRDAIVANGMVPFGEEWLIYYGAADRNTGLAVSRMKGDMRHG